MPRQIVGTASANVRRVSVRVLECQQVSFATRRVMVEMASANAHRLLMPVVWPVKNVFLGLASVVHPRLVKIYQQGPIVT